MTSIRHHPASTDTDRSMLRRRAWTVTALLTAFIVVNFADKAVTGLAATQIQDELGLTAERFGLVQSSFYWLFAASAAGVGLFMNRIPLKPLLAGLAAVWVLTMLPMIGSVGFGVLLLTRVVLGAAEGPAYALAMHLTHTWFPADKRALPSMIVGAGSSIGPLIATPALTAVIVAHGWHAAFAVLAVVGVVWTAAWLWRGAVGPEQVSATTAGGQAVHVSYGRLFRNPTVIGAALLLFCAYVNTTLKLSWLPSYLEKGLGYSASTVGWLAALPYAVAAVLGILAGLVSGRLTARGVRARWARAVPACGFVAVAGLAELCFPLVGRGWFQMVLVALAFSLTSMAFGMTFSVISDVVPGERRGVVMSVVVAFYSLAGIIAPYFLGFVVDAAADPVAGFAAGFKVTGAVVLAGALVALFLVDPDRDAFTAGRKDPRPSTV